MGGASGGNLRCMTDPRNNTADDTGSAASGTPESAAVASPAEDVAPDVDVAEVTADDAAAPETSPDSTDAALAGGGQAPAEDYKADAAAPEPPS